MDISFHLQILPAEGAPFDHVFREDSLVVGRAADAGLSLPDPFLSRRHSRFYRQGVRLFVEDLGSRNGTLLNGQAIHGPAELKPGDVVRISNSTILISLDRPGTPQKVVDDDPLDGTILRRASELLDRQSSPEAARLQNEADLRRYAERMKILNEIHQALGRSLTLSGLLELILDRVFDHLQPDRGAIFLKEADGELRPAAVRTPAGVADEVRVSRSLVREVTEKGMAALVLDVLSDDRFSAAQSMLLSGIRSLVAAPLLDTEGTLGLIVLESRVQARQFTEEDLELLVSLASVAALHIRNLALAMEAAARRRLEEELALARRIQVALLPSKLPEIAGWELHGGNIPSRGVSGDYYEVVERLDGREVVLMVADVSGKGMAASLFTPSRRSPWARSKTASPPTRSAPASPGSSTAARRPRSTPRPSWASSRPKPAACATRTPGTTRRSSSARRGTVEELASTGVPLGLLPVAPYEAGEVTLSPGDTLVLYTDGLAEAMDPDGEEYGLERMTAVCLRHRGEPCRQLAAALEEDLDHFVRGVPYADDRTVVMARRL